MGDGAKKHAVDQAHTVYLSAGSNAGDRRANLERAFALLAERGAVLQKVSSYFESEPVGYVNQPWFLNVVLEVRTHLSPVELLETSLTIERQLGRVRSFQGAPRPLDLDILLYEKLVITEPSLIVPHPRMTERRFVLEPLAEIAPEAIHPMLGLTVRSLLASCPDSSAVRLYLPGGTS